MPPVKVAVIGAGIIGSSLSYHLAKLGARVTVIAESGAGGIATPATFAWINASWGNPEPYYRMRYASMMQWRQLALDLPGLGASWTGSLTYDLGAADLIAFVERAQGYGYPIRLIDGEETARLEPRLKRPPALAAFAEAEGAVEPASAVRELLQGSGARLITGRVVDIETMGDRVVAVRTVAERIECDLVVVAAGVGTPGLLAMVGVKLALQAPPGLIVHTAPLPDLLRLIVIAPDIHFRQTMDRRIIAAADFGGSPIDGDPDKVAADLLALLRDKVEGAEDAAIERYTIGYRPMPVDELPIIGFAARPEGLYIAVMHSGMTNAPAVGAFGAEEMLNGRRDPLLGPFGPQRL